MATLPELENALRKAHAAGNTEHARRFADEIRKMRGSDFSGVSTNVDSSYQVVPRVTREQRQAQIAQADAALNYENRLNSLNQQEQAGRLSGIGGRGILTGLAAIPDLAVSPITNLVNRALPENMQQRDIGGSVNALLDALGTARAETPGERIYQDTTSGVTSAVVPVGIGNTLARSARPVVSGVGRTLASNPLAQIIGGGTGAVASSSTREAGGGPMAQLGAGFLGALAPFAATPRFANSTAAERRAMQQIINEAEDPRKIAIANQSQVPGVVRTLGEESGDAGVAALERQMRGYRPQVFSPQDRSNAANRVASMQRIAGEGTDMADAIADRAKQTGDLRDAAFREADQISEQAALYGAAPAGNVSNLRQQLLAMSAAEGGRSAVRRSIDNIVSELDAAEPSAQGLYKVRKSINDMLEGIAGSERDYARAARPELLQARALLDAELANIAPEFGNYLTAFQRLSRPINRMEMGREILERGAGGAVPDIDTGIRPLTPAAMSRQTLDLDALAQRATGFEKARAEDILTPNDVAAIRAVQDDLERQYFRSTASAPGGSPTEPRRAMAEKLTSVAAGKIPYGNMALDFFRNQMKQQHIDTLTQLIANPAEARRVLTNMSPKDRAVITKAMIQLSAAQAEEKNQ